MWRRACSTRPHAKRLDPIRSPTRKINDTSFELDVHGPYEVVVVCDDGMGDILDLSVLVFSADGSQSWFDDAEISPR